KSDSGSRGTVVGHSDSDGSHELNQSLSMERAQAVASVLRLGGIERHRMHLIGMAANAPRADNSTYTGRKLNRRVEIILTPYQPTSVALADATKPCSGLRASPTPGPHSLLLADPGYPVHGPDANPLPRRKCHGLDHPVDISP